MKNSSRQRGTMHTIPPEHEKNVARFDEAAATWEEKPLRVALAAAIVAGLRSHISLQPSMRVLEYGCGTGMISRAISPLVHSVLAMDSSPGMLAVLREKTREEGVANISTVVRDLSREDPTAETFDLIVSGMAMHHIAALETVTDRLFSSLRPGGYLAVADLAPEDGSFHEENSGVAHFGIDPALLLGLFQRHGVRQAASREVHAVLKNGRRYPILLTWCQKNSAEEAGR